VWRGLTGGRSVHLTDFPSVSDLPADDALVAAMDEVRDVCSTALSLRKANKLRVRQPLARLTVAVEHPESLRDYAGLLTGELNVKAVDLVPLDSGTAERFGITERLAVNARAAGPRLGRGVQAVIKAAKAGSWERVVDASGTEQVVVSTDDGQVPLQEGEYELNTVVADGAATAEVAASVLPGGGFAVLDLALDAGLLAEGYARDVVRDVQDARKAAGLEVSDRIDLELDVPAAHVADVEAHRELVMRETLAVTLEVVPVDGGPRAVRVTKTEERA
jgi:isoleucyl-tRNA synthetase